jgi:hypothetical protein
LALLEDLAKGAATPTGLLVGIGTVLLAPMLMPAVSQALRPTAKAVMRTGITLYRSTVEPVVATVSELVTEAQLEMATASAEPEPAASDAEPAEHSKSARNRNRGSHS